MSKRRKRSVLVPAEHVGFIRAAKRMYRDSSIPFRHKLILIIGGWYWAVPDPTDIVPVIGWLDEMGVSGWFLALVIRAQFRYRKREAIRVGK